MIRRVSQFLTILIHHFRYFLGTSTIILPPVDFIEWTTLINYSSTLENVSNINVDTLAISICRMANKRKNISPQT